MNISALPAFKVEIDELFEGTVFEGHIELETLPQVILQLLSAWREVPMKPHSSGLPRIHMARMIIEFVRKYLTIILFDMQKTQRATA